MSDIDRPTLQRAPILIANKCHCGAWAGFGFAPPGGREETQWWCWTHYPYQRSGSLPKAVV